MTAADEEWRLLLRDLTVERHRHVPTIAEAEERLRPAGTDAAEFTAERRAELAQDVAERRDEWDRRHLKAV